MHRSRLTPLLAAPIMTLGLAAAGTAASAAPPAAAAPTSCTVARLPLPAGVSNVEVTGGDPTGRYLLGHVLYQDGAPKPSAARAVVWRDGTVLTTLRTGGNVNLVDVNSSGVAVGSAGNYPASPPSVYQNGKLSALPGAKRGWATGINDRGAVAGVTFTGTADTVTAVRWPSATSAPVVLRAPTGYQVHRVSGIDEDGTVVGVVGRTAETGVGYVWRPDNTGYLLPRPPVTEGLVLTHHDVTAVRNGHVAVNAWVPDSEGERGKYWAFRFNLATGRYEPTGGYLGQQWVDGTAVNAAGWLTTVGGLINLSANLLTDAGFVELPTIVTPGPADTAARALSDDGHTIGGSVSRGDFSQPVRWHCS